MAPLRAHPLPRIGEYYKARGEASTVTCKAYDAPWPHGRYICSLAPGATFGPVKEVLVLSQLVVVLVRGYWINVKGYKEIIVQGNCQYAPVAVAVKVPGGIVDQWRARGWRD